MVIIAMRISLCNSETDLTSNTLGYRFTSMKTTLAERLNIAMQLRGNMTQGALAKASGISQPTIWRLIKGEAKGTKKLVDIANALNVNAEWLANGVGDMEGNNPTPRVDRIDNNSYVPVWTVSGQTNDSVVAPDGKVTPHWRAYILDRNSGCSEAPAGSIVIVDTSLKPGTNDLVVAINGGSVSVYRFLDGGSDGYLSVDDSRIPLLDLSLSAELVGVAIFILRDLRR